MLRIVISHDSEPQLLFYLAIEIISKISKIQDGAQMSHCIYGLKVSMLTDQYMIQGIIYSLSGRTSYRKIPSSLESRDSGLDFSSRSNIWQALRQQRYRGARQMSERYDHYSIQSRGIENSRDLTVRRPPV